VLEAERVGAIRHQSIITDTQQQCRSARGHGSAPANGFQLIRLVVKGNNLFTPAAPISVVRVQCMLRIDDVSVLNCVRMHVLCIGDAVQPSKTFGECSKRSSSNCLPPVQPTQCCVL